MPITLEGVASDGMNPVYRTWSVDSINGGLYELNNVLPGSVIITPRNVWGSDPEVPPSSMSFKEGWAGVGSSSMTITLGNPPLPQTDKNLQVIKMGSIKFMVTDLQTGAPVAANLPVLLPGDGGYSRWDRWQTFTTDSQGLKRLWNVVPDDRTMPFDAFVQAGPQCFTSDLDLGYFLPAGSGSASLVPVIENPVNLAMERGRRLKGVAVDAVTGAPLAGVGVATRSLDWNNWLSTSADSDGKFQFCGVRVQQAPNLITLNFSDPNRRLSATVYANTLSVQETAFNQPVPGMKLVTRSPGSQDVRSGACPGMNLPIVSDANGRFPDVCLSSIFYRSQSAMVPAGLFPLWDIGTVQVVTNKADVGLRATEPNSRHFSDVDLDVSITDGAPYAGAPVAFVTRLVAFPVTGMVKDSRSGQPLAGINVTSPYRQTVLTAADGTYSTLAHVQNRWPGSAGEVILAAGGGIASNTGYLYDNTAVTQSLPQPFSLTSPLSKDFSLQPQGSGL
jgi:hypothetical protein